jgi:hypothetical protein
LNSDEAKRIWADFLAGIFRFLLETKDSWLITEDNFLNREILPLLKSNVRHGLPISDFSKRNFVDLNKTAAAMQPTDVVLFDLAARLNSDIKEKITGANSQYICVPFLHGLDIPVGIGFSLPTLPFVTRRVQIGNDKSVASILREAVVKAVKANSNELMKAILKDGIELDDDFFSAGTATMPTVNKADLTTQALVDLWEGKL